MNLIYYMIYIACLSCYFANSRHATESKKTYHRHALLRITAKNANETEFVRWLEESNEEHVDEIDFWINPSQPGMPADALVAPTYLPKLLRELRARNISHSIVNQDVMKLIEAEKQSMAFSSSVQLDQTSRSLIRFNLATYHNFNEITHYLEEVDYKYPSLANVFYGSDNTYENRRLTGVKIGNSRFAANRNKRPAIFIEAGVHAREWISPAVALFTVHKLVQGYAKNATIRNFLDHMDFYILPVTNPDGYEYTRRTDRMWRKNRNPNNNGASDPDFCNGVDLNRNFDWKWGGKGSSSNKCSNSFRGVAPFSEPEARSVRNIVSGIGSRLKAYFALHSYAQLWAYPYGHDRNMNASDSFEVAKVARTAVEQLKSYHGTRYAVDTMANYLYPAAGMSQDWAKGRKWVKYSYLVELRPRSEYDGGFVLPAYQIASTSEETFEAIMVVARRVLETVRKSN